MDIVIPQLPQTDSESALGIQASGPITGVTIPCLIQSVSSTGDSGVLTLQDGDLQKSAYARDGKIVFARSNDPNDRLGEILLRQGLVSVRALEQCSNEVATSRKRLGGILVEKNLITPKNLIEGVRNQVREILHSMFQWTRGEYQFLKGPPPTEEVITLKVNMCDVIRTGIRRIETWSRIREAVGGLEARYRYRKEFDDKRADLELSPEENGLLERLAETASVGELCDALGGNNFETFRQLWAFHVMGALEKLDAGPTGSA